MQEIAVGVITDVNDRNITVQIDKYKAPVIYNMVNAMINSIDFDNLSAFIIDDVIKRRFLDTAISCEEFNVNLTKDDMRREGFGRIKRGYYTSGQCVATPLKSRVGDSNNRISGTYDHPNSRMVDRTEFTPIPKDDIFKSVYIPSPDSIKEFEKKLEDYDKFVEENDGVIEPEKMVNMVSIIPDNSSNKKKNSAKKIKSDPIPIMLGDVIKEENSNVDISNLPHMIEFRCAKCGKPILRSGEALNSFVYGVYNGTIKYGPFCDKDCEKKFLKQKLYQNMDNLLIIKDNFEKIGFHKDIDMPQHIQYIDKKSEKKERMNSHLTNLEKYGTSEKAKEVVPDEEVMSFHSNKINNNKHLMEVHECAYCHKKFTMTKDQSDKYHLALSINPNKKVYCSMAHMIADRKKSDKLLLVN